MNDYDIDLDSCQQTATEERETPCEFVCGVAGSGKTFNQVKAVADDPSYGILSATTGIASVNLGATTIHSLLKYSTTEVLRDHYLSGALSRVLHSIARRVRWLIIDEASMAVDEQLDLWYRGVCDANRFVDVEEPLGIRLVGDLAQLPPVPDQRTKRVPWIFEANCWQRFAENTHPLTTPYRQKADDPFYKALNLIRRGEGAAGADVISGMGAKFESQLDTEFDGTTILPKNDMVRKYNEIGLDRVKGEKFTVHSRRWGKQQSEWGQNLRTKEWGIPPSVDLKVGAYVMLLSNRLDLLDGGFEYVNGQCGHIIAWDIPPQGPAFICVRLEHSGKEVYIHRLVRGVESTEKPLDFPTDAPRIKASEDLGEWLPRPHYRGKVRRYVTGQIEYFPVRLAYATTVHKSQSLTLDKVQVDYRNHFFASPGMLYVALSRCRTLEGLRLVGQREVFAKHCNFDPKIKEWL